MKKVFKYLFLALLPIILIVFLYLLLPGLWNKWFDYPDFQDDVNAFQHLRNLICTEKEISDSPTE